MPRRDDDRDDDDDRDYDRPHKKSSNSTLWIVLGVLFAAIVLGVVGCVGIVGLGVFRAGKAINETMQSVGGMTASDAFLNDLQSNRTGPAYESTSTAYKAKTTKVQFDEFLAKNSTLTKHTVHTMSSFNATGEPPNQKVVVVYRLSASDFGMDDEDDPDEEPKPKKKVTPMTKKGLPKDAPPPDINVTITMTNEGGVWKVETITIP